ncbi:hypothetical protein ABZX65_32980 [Streptomyces sp. NPDC003300]|uniref:ATP-dependent DNA ligase n=1 Tax=unclassified Streptomyces TaxID=2593676 RepID=UPI0033BC043D
MVMRREVGGVRCQARSGRDSTRSWPDLAAAGTALEPGTVLDGEAVVFTGGVIDFSAAQSRMASSPARAAALARDLPASYAVFDILATARLGDVRPWPWTQRRQLLLDTLEPLGPPIQPVPATDGRDVALAWYETLRAQGIEGLVAKRGDGRYRAGRIWKKAPPLRHRRPCGGRLHRESPPAPRPGGRTARRAPCDLPAPRSAHRRRCGRPPPPGRLRLAGPLHRRRPLHAGGSGSDRGSRCGNHPPRGRLPCQVLLFRPECPRSPDAVHRHTTVVDAWDNDHQQHAVTRVVGDSVADDVGGRLGA